MGLYRFWESEMSESVPSCEHQYEVYATSTDGTALHWCPKCGNFEDVEGAYVGDYYDYSE